MKGSLKIIFSEREKLIKVQGLFGPSCVYFTPCDISFSAVFFLSYLASPFHSLQGTFVHEELPAALSQRKLSFLLFNTYFFGGGVHLKFIISLLRC